MDFLSKKERSKRMSLIRSKWTKQERKIHNHLKAKKIEHRMHPVLKGKPDILVNERLVLFLHGCFWHGCRKCYVLPSTRRAYWRNKIERNTKRHLRSTKFLRSQSFKVLTIWEHDINKDLEAVMQKIEKGSSGLD